MVPRDFSWIENYKLIRKKCILYWKHPLLIDYRKLFETTTEYLSGLWVQRGAISLIYMNFVQVEKLKKS